MALIGEAGRHGDVGEGIGSREHSRRRPFHAEAPQILHDRGAVLRPKHPREMRGMDADLGGERGHANRFSEAIAQQLFHPRQPWGWRTPAVTFTRAASDRDEQVDRGRFGREAGQRIRRSKLGAYAMHERLDPSVKEAKLGLHQWKECARAASSRVELERQDHGIPFGPRRPG